MRAGRPYSGDAGDRPNTATYADLSPGGVGAARGLPGGQETLLPGVS